MNHDRFHFPPRYFAARIYLALQCALGFWMQPAFAEDWPRYRGPRGDGSWQQNIQEKINANSLGLAWSQPLGGGYAGISVSDGLVYVMDYQRANEAIARHPMPGQQSERISCFNAQDGSLVWQSAYLVEYGKLDYGNGPRATPTVDRGLVYILGAVGHLHCLNAKTGRVVWSKDLVQEAGAKIPEWGLAASPVIWNDLLIVHAGCQPEGCLIALDRQTGAERWRVSSDPAGYATPRVMPVARQQQLVAWTPLNILGVDPGSGKIRWSIPYEVTYGVSIASPIFYQDLVFVTGYWEGTKTISVDAATGQGSLLWENADRLRGLMAQPVRIGSQVYSLDRERGLTCVALETGNILWNDKEHALTPDDRNPHLDLVTLHSPGSIQATNGETGRALGLNAQGELMLLELSPQAFHVFWKRPVIERSDSQAIWAQAAFADDKLFVRNHDHIRAIQLPLAP